jgi:hypothetical protein
VSFLPAEPAIKAKTRQVTRDAQPLLQNDLPHCCRPRQDQASNQQERIFFPASRLSTASLSPMPGRLT